LPGSLLKKGLSENGRLTLGFDDRIPNPIRRDKPIQRLKFNF